MADLPTTQDAHEFIAALDEVDLSHFRVVGAYTRFDEAVRNALQDTRQKIVAGFEPPGCKREDHLIWAAPGSGKTYFVQQVAASLPPGIRYHELSLAKCTEPEFRSGLGALDGNKACLCLVDEIDAKPQDPWPYEVLLPYLDAAVDREARFVFVLAGSSGSSLDGIKQRIAARPKGPDLLSRIPTGHEYEIGPMTLGDRILIVLSQLRQAGWEAGREIRAVEKIGLCYVALNPRLANARQLREFAVRAVERVPKSDDRVKYDHLFTPGDPENKAFWVQALPLAKRLITTYVILRGDRVGSALPTGVAPSLAPAEAALASALSVAVGTRPRTNLPRRLTSFIGRDREIAEVKRLLPTAGLLTLTGTGGCGKTRLALRVVADLVDQYPDGVWVAELAALPDPALVPNAVASALNVPEQPGRSLTETLVDAVRSKSLLLVLDNCEHLLPACAQLAEVLLSACPTLRVVATSREPLGIPGEVIWRVPSLSVPSLKHLPPIEQLIEYEAVHLFVDRAALSQPGFRVTSANAAVVAQVTHRLDGIPLAIELAAARVKVLPVEGIATRLNDQFRLLTGGSRTALPRHQTLRATMDWSYGLLSQKERTVLRRLSVFAGGWSLAAAETVCSGKRIKGHEVLDLLTQLADKSLVVVETQGGEARYRLLETVRQYGRDRLVETGEAADARRRHRDYYLALAEQTELELRGPDQGAWLKRLDTEYDNLRVALDWSKMEGGTLEAGLRLAGALYVFWEVCGFSEGREWLEGMLSQAKGTSPAVRAKALNAAAFLAHHQGDFQRLPVLCSEALALCRALGDEWGSAFALHFLAHAAESQGDYVQAIETMEEAVALCRSAGDKWWRAASLNCLGEIVRLQGDYERAVGLSEESLRLARELGDKRHVAASLVNMGVVVGLQGDYGRAEAMLKESLALLWELGYRWRISYCLLGLGRTACGLGQFERGARLFGAAAALRQVTGAGLPPSVLAEGDRTMTTLRGALGDAAFATAWAEGRAMTPEQTIGYALGPAPRT